MTRQEYLYAYLNTRNAEKQRATHREYYAQFVTPPVRQMVASRFTIPELRATFYGEHPGSTTRPTPGDWDRLVPLLGGRVSAKLRDHGDHLTPIAGVCILKEAGRQVLESHT